MHPSTIDIRTANYSFTIEIFQDEARFVAKLNGVTPSLAQQVGPVESLTYFDSIDEQEVRGNDQDSLVGNCRARINEIDGEILTEREL